MLSAVRTPVGRYGGALGGVRPDDLAAIAIAAAVERAGVDAGEIEDVYLGCANQAGEDNRNVARMAALLAGLPESVAGVTVNRLCASGLSAVVGACHAIAAGDGDLFVAGGVESMSRAPLVWPSRTPPSRAATAPCTTPRSAGASRTRAGGEVPARVDGRDRRERRRAVGRLARGPGRVRAPLAAAVGRRPTSPTSSCRSGTSTRTSTRDPDTSAEKLAALKPAFREGGTVTAGNSSGVNDGAAALVIASEEKARELGVEPLGAFVASAVAGVDPRVMGIGPVPAVRKLLDRAGIGVADLDLVELNEAFASQSLAVVRELGLDEERVNVNGGAIALGHPLGMSGARLVVTLLHELRRRGGRYGLATMCVGVGQGQAALFERVTRLAPRSWRPWPSWRSLVIALSPGRRGVKRAAAGARGRPDGGVRASRRHARRRGDAERGHLARQARPGSVRAHVRAERRLSRGSARPCPRGGCGSVGGRRRRRPASEASSPRSGRRLAASSSVSQVRDALLLPADVRAAGAPIALRHLG